MIHKVLRHGRKGNPFAYLLHADREVAAVVLRGDVVTCWAAIRAATYRQKYTSIVLSCAEELSLPQESEIIDDYERVAFAGRAEEFARVWVRHKEHGRTELHLVVANVHLPTGKRWSHYYDRADRKYFKAWQELVNIRYGLASPDAPERKRLADMPGKLPVEKKALFERLDELVCAGVANGEISSRVEVVKALESAGYEVKLSRNYVSVKAAGSEGKLLRLRGKKYVEDFSREALVASALPKTIAQEADRKSDYEKEFREGFIRREAFVGRVRQPRKRGQPNPQDEASSELANAAEAAICQKITSPQVVEAGPFSPQSLQPEIIDEPRLGTIISTSLLRSDAAGGRALFKARNAAWSARLAATCSRVSGFVKRIRAAHAYGRRTPCSVGLPAFFSQPFCVGRHVVAGLLDRLVRREAGGTELSRAGAGEPAATVGPIGREHREREGPSGLSM